MVHIPYRPSLDRGMTAQDLAAPVGRPLSVSVPEPPRHDNTRSVSLPKINPMTYHGPPPGQLAAMLGMDN